MPPEPVTDPIAVLLARIEVKLDNSLAEQGRHTSILDRHERILGDHSNQLAVLQAVDERDDRHTQRSYSGKTVFWSAAAAVVAAVALFVMIVLSIRSGG
jgi:hypothetical protein